ncbi:MULTISPECIES: class I SAM-dependent methyltransferase [unclassified Synechocystis]|uniref:class I SAM-dependent methyltransferase n=1 Tax=unclassified Synechocystis TaxID=2640012 RepID=UPI00040D84ED|nr:MULTISPECIES: class I SAM-dependent methyltransferase [unclassified Synechocystis]AIE76029.1 SAM-dependent methyltransferase [Synechocystis sp. PCC 6714]MCT0255065.1 class I SAM-dependent methyltransferase [Synechocystis sp. CS-94]
MATIFRTWSYQYPWVYALVSRLATLNVGGEKRFHQLPLRGLVISPGQKVLDLCCGGGQATAHLVQTGATVVGLDASPKALAKAKTNVPQATYVQGLAEDLPFGDQEFDLVHTSVALHEMNPEQLEGIISGVERVLKSGGIFTLVDLHRPSNWLFWPPLAIFMGLFETETAWQLINTDLVALLEQAGFTVVNHSLYAGGSLQVIQARADKVETKL